MIMPDCLTNSMRFTLGKQQTESEILELITLPAQEKVLKRLNKEIAKKKADSSAKRYFENRSIIVIAREGRLAYYKLMGVSS